MDNKYPRHEIGYKSGGVHMNKYGNSTSTQKVLKMMVKKIKSQIYKGQLQDIFRIDKPVIVNTDMPLMQCFAMDFQYINEIMNQYFNQPDYKFDPIERMKYLSSALVAGHHNSTTVLRDKVPVDPVLGETLFVEKEQDNVQMYFECVSSDPQILRYLYHSEHLTINGNGWITVSINPITNKAIGKRNGTNTLTFQNGDQIDIKCCQLQVSGVIIGDLVSNFTGVYQMIDPTNNIMCEVTYNPEYNNKSSLQKMVHGIKGMFSTSDRLTDDIQINIYQITFKDQQIIKGQLIKQGFGNWLSHVIWDDQVIWHLKQSTTAFQIKNILSSDSMFRSDILNITKQDLDQAQKQRDILIDQIDKDKTLRNKQKQSQQNNGDEQKLNEWVDSYY